MVWPPSKPWSASQTLPSASLTGSDLPALIRIAFAAGRGCRAGLAACLRNDFNRADLRVLDLGREGDLDLAVGDFDGDRLHVGLQEPARLDPNVEVLELLPLDVEGKHALTRPGDALEGFREMQFHHVLPVGHRPRKGVHAVVFRPVEVGTLGVGNLDVGPFDGLAALEALVGQPDIAFSVFDRLGFAGLDPDRLGGRRGCGGAVCSRLATISVFGKLADLARELDFVAVGRELAGVGDANLVVLDSSASRRTKSCRRPPCLPSVRLRASGRRLPSWLSRSTSRRPA